MSISKHSLARLKKAKAVAQKKKFVLGGIIGGPSTTRFPSSRLVYSSPPQLSGSSKSRKQLQPQFPPIEQTKGTKMNNGKLNGKVALVTGGNSGIGLATAKRFVSESAYVFITGRRQQELDAAVKEIGRNVTAVQGDVSRLADLDRLFAHVKKEKGS